MTDVQLIGILKNVKTTHNGHRLIELEDDTGSATLIALKSNTEIMQLAGEVMLDEVIGIVGKISKNGDLIIIQNIIYPDIKMHQDRKRIEPPLCVAFLSDVHIGSKMFMDAEWNAFLRWINGDLGNSRQRDVASKLKYLVLPGDLVDGIGIYPNQEKELSISNIYDQYQALAKQFEYIPDHITILLEPGNHDAVRPAEPQPAFEKEIPLRRPLDDRFGVRLTLPDRVPMMFCLPAAGCGWAERLVRAMKPSDLEQNARKASALLKAMANECRC